MASGSTRAVVVALPTYVVSTALAVAVNFATDYWRSSVVWLAVAALVAVSAVVAALSAAGQRPADPRPPPAQYPPHYPPVFPTRPPPRRSRRVAGAVAATVVVVLLAASVLAVRFVFGLVTGRESGVDRLVEPASARTGALTLTVDRVEVTAHFTRVEMSADNRGDDALSLPVFGNCQLTAGRLTKGGDSFASDWPDNIPPGGVVSGVVVFRAVLPPDTTAATVSFATIFGSLSTRGSIVVRDIPIRPDPG